MNKIATHEDIFRVPFLTHVGHFWFDRQGGKPLPDARRAQNFVNAYINHGRWIAECPSGCGHAVVASSSAPFYICNSCANASNGGEFYRVRFPANRTAIEVELLKRPVRTPIHSKPWSESTRNWVPGESVDDLRAEAAARGIK